MYTYPNSFWHAQGYLGPSHATLFNPNIPDPDQLKPTETNQPYHIADYVARPPTGKVLDISASPSFGKMRPHLSPIFVYCVGFLGKEEENACAAWGNWSETTLDRARSHLYLQGDSFALRSELG